MGNQAEKRAGGLLITDNELREIGMSEIEIDRLNHKVETQLVSINGRDRAAVEAWLSQRGVTIKSEASP